MNRKQGDLAVIVRAVDQSFIGRFVTCLEFVPAVEGVGPTGLVSTLYGAWLVDLPPPKWAERYTNNRNVYALDSSLRPLRDTDGDDETLTWAGKPSTINQPTKENA